MKRTIYEMIVDTWRLAAKHQFQKMDDTEWESFVAEGNKLLTKYRAKGKVIERLYRDLFTAFQEFYQKIGKAGSGNGNDTK